MARACPSQAIFAAPIIVLAGALAGCGGGGDKTVTETVQTVTETTSIGTVTGTETTTTGEAGSVEAATGVLSGLIDRAINDPTFNSKGFRSDPAITQGFVVKIDQLISMNKAQGFPGLDFDPFVCAQQLPQGATYEPARVAGDNMTINGRFTYGGGKPVEVTYGMVLEDGQWKLDSDDCVEQALSK